MNKIHLLLYSLFLSGTIHCQFGPEHIITTEANGCRQIFVADLDGDDLIDVAGANKFSSTVLWYKNLGLGSYSTPEMVGNISEPIYVSGGDIDGDEDVDLVSLEYFNDRIFWFENDGSGTFTSHEIETSNQVDGPYSLFLADIDGDNDLDIVCAANFSGLSWFENLDGNGNFGPARLIDTASANRSVMAVDLDGDDYLDVVASSSGSFTVAWYKNLDGLGNFGTRQIIAGSALAVQNLFSADLDGDEDMDVITATNALNKVAWFENIDGLGNFSGEQVISLEADTVVSVIAADLDNDLDMDVLSGSVGDGKVAWYENLDGNGTFSGQKIISTNSLTPYDVKFGDLDNDGDMDVISGSQNDDKVAWYENLTILSVDSNIANKVSIVPNPVEDSFGVQSDYPVGNVRVMNASGMLLMEIEENFEQISIKNLQSGLYLIEVEIEHHMIVKKLVKQ